MATLLIIDKKSLVKDNSSKLPSCIILRKTGVYLSGKAAIQLGLAKESRLVFAWHEGRKRLMVSPVHKNDMLAYPDAIELTYSEKKNEYKISSARLSGLLQQYDGYSLMVGGEQKTSVRFELAPTFMEVEKRNWLIFE